MTRAPTPQVAQVLASPLFDSRYYARNVNLMFHGRQEAAEHYLNYGWYQGHDPGPNFDTYQTYRSDPAMALSAICPLLYHHQYAATERQLERAPPEATLLRGVFDADFYLATQRDVAQSGVEPFQHYLHHGAREGRAPYPRPSCPALEAISDAYRNGQAKQAMARLESYLAACKPPEPRWLLGSILLAEISLMLGQHRRCQQLCEALQALSWKAYYPYDYDRLCGHMTQSLCEQGEYAQAREWLLAAYQHLEYWHPAPLTRLRSTLRGPADLARYAILIESQLESTGSDPCHNLLQYSLAARDTGHMALALRLIKQRLIQGLNQQHRFGEQPRLAEPSWQVSARQALLDLKHCLDKADIEFFLVSGTLLGCVRDHDIIAHDKDIDIGVMAPVSLQALTQACQGSGYFKVLPYVNDKLIRVLHVNGVMADIFIHWEEGGRIHHHGRRTGWWNTRFALTETRFLGETFLVPADTRTYLKENYGNWEEPDPGFDTFADTPNMYVVCKDELCWYLQKTLLDHFVAGDRESMQRLARTARQYFYDQPQLAALVQYAIIKSQT